MLQLLLVFQKEIKDNSDNMIKIQFWNREQFRSSELLQTEGQFTTKNKNSL